MDKITAEVVRCNPKTIAIGLCVAGVNFYNFMKENAKWILTFAFCILIQHLLISQFVNLTQSGTADEFIPPLAPHFILHVTVLIAVGVIFGIIASNDIKVDNPFGMVIIFAMGWLSFVLFFVALSIFMIVMFLIAYAIALPPLAFNYMVELFVNYHLIPNEYYNRDKIVLLFYPVILVSAIFLCAFKQLLNGLCELGSKQIAKQ